MVSPLIKPTDATQLRLTAAKVACEFPSLKHPLTAFTSSEKGPMVEQLLLLKENKALYFEKLLENIDASPQCKKFALDVINGADNPYLERLVYTSLIDAIESGRDEKGIHAVVLLLFARMREVRNALNEIRSDEIRNMLIDHLISTGEFLMDAMKRSLRIDAYCRLFVEKQDNIEEKLSKFEPGFARDLAVHYIRAAIWNDERIDTAFNVIFALKDEIAAVHARIPEGKRRDLFEADISQSLSQLSLVEGKAILRATQSVLSDYSKGWPAPDQTIG